MKFPVKCPKNSRFGIKNGTKIFRAGITLVRKATKPYEIIYVTAFVSTTIVDGDVVTYIALDEFQDFLFPPVMLRTKSSDEELIGKLVEFFNGINQKYNPNIHSRSTTYVVDIPEELIPLIKGMVTQNDSVVYDPQKVQTIFKPIFAKFNSEFRPKTQA